MEWLASGKRGLRAELAQLRAAFADRQLWLALALFALLLALVSQSPLDYRINVGHEEGYGSDLPMLAGFHDFERANNDTIALRWTTEIDDPPPWAWAARATGCYPAITSE